MHIFNIFFLIYSFFSSTYRQIDIFIHTYLCIHHSCSYMSCIFYFNLFIITINPLQTGLVALYSVILLQINLFIVSVSVLEYKDLKLQLCYYTGIPCVHIYILLKIRQEPHNFHYHIQFSCNSLNRVWIWIRCSVPYSPYKGGRFSQNLLGEKSCFIQKSQVFCNCIPGMVLFFYLCRPEQFAENTNKAVMFVKC